MVLYGHCGLMTAPERPHQRQNFERHSFGYLTDAATCQIGTDMAPETSPPAAHRCPRCPYTDTTLKKVLHHMESAHYHCWCDLALYPPIAGGELI
jgi:hypothetical protein